MDYGLKSKVVVVCGGAGEIGKAIVSAFLEEGSKVVIADISVEQGKKVAEELGKELPGTQVQGVYWIDVRSEDSVRKAVASIVGDFGRIDVLVNSFGILCRKSFFDTTISDFEDSMRVNVLGVFLVSKEVAQAMWDQAAGTIINISSINSKLAIENRSAYGSTKAAVDLLTKSMALELAQRNITVNAVAPGVVDSPMARVRLNTPEIRRMFESAIPINHLTTPKDVADCVIFLASSRARNITGEIIYVDGGLTSRQALPRL